jgi:hypothetical protein
VDFQSLSSYTPLAFVGLISSIFDFSGISHILDPQHKDRSRSGLATKSYFLKKCQTIAMQRTFSMFRGKASRVNHNIGSYNEDT